jgi:hypothetical protein
MMGGVSNRSAPPSTGFDGRPGLDDFLISRRCTSQKTPSERRLSQALTIRSQLSTTPVRRRALTIGLTCRATYNATSVEKKSLRGELKPWPGELTVVRQNWVGASRRGNAAQAAMLGSRINQNVFNGRLLSDRSVEERSACNGSSDRTVSSARGRVCALRGLPFVAVMKTTDFRNRDDRSGGWR